MPALSSIRTMLRPILRPVRARSGGIGTLRRKGTYLRYGIDGIARDLRTSVYDQATILREYGATVGDRVMFPGPITVVNAARDFSNLSIGNDCHIGAETLFDLAERISIEDFATLSMRTTLITHIDAGPGPLSVRRPRKTGPVRIGRGAYLGAGATVLHGVSVGAEATVGAHALVDRDIPAGTTVISPRAQPLG